MGGMQPLEQIENAAGRGFIEVARRFIGQQQPGVANQGSRQRHALLLAAGKLSGPVVGTIFQVDLPEPVRCHCECLASTLAARHQRHGYVFKRRKLRQKIVKLPDVAYLAVAKGCRLSLRKSGYIG